MKKYFSIFILSCLFLALSTGVYAEWTEESPPSGFYLVPDCVFGTHSCGACDFLHIATNAASVILSILSACVLLMIVVGGFYLITSGGNQDRVGKGKKILTAAIVGTLIIAFAWVGVNTLLGILVGRNATEINNSVALFGSSGNTTPWWQFPTCETDPVAQCNVEGISVGTPCNTCNSQGATGDKNCFCHIMDTTTKKGKLAESENEGSCTGKNGTCSCVSLCEKLARDYTAYSKYECMDVDRSGYDLGGEPYGSCLSGDFCPHKSTEDPTHYCCEKLK